MKSTIRPIARILFLLSLIYIIPGISCKHKQDIKIDEAVVIHDNVDQLTQVIIYDVFTPPVASRIYVYSSLAAFEAIKFSKPGTPGIVNSLHGFGSIPEPEKSKEYNFTLAATKAFFTVIRKLVFSTDSLSGYETSVYEKFQQTVDKDVYDRSLHFGDSVGSVILSRANKDGYAKSRGKAKYLGSEEDGKWRPTPPDYLDGVEWCWNTMAPMVLDSASQFYPPAPPVYSKDSTSAFYKGVKEVYDISKNFTAEQKTIARYWDDNPFVIEHSGHMMFGNKKITPGGHWMGIAAIASQQSKDGPVEAARAYAATAIALYDGFIACWDGKYKTNIVRPVTVIDQWFQNTWTPFLQTPPFPEYPSGHSVISASASTVLTHIYGDNFSFNDTSDLRYIGMQRKFSSFKEAAAEASISRVYGGIHYRTGVEAGAEQGKKVGELVAGRILTAK
jgi:membrane-associated phospholipid phosphatase